MRRTIAIIGLGLTMAGLSMAASAQGGDDPLTRAIPFNPTRGWTTSQKPMRIYGNSYLVGYAGLTVALIRTSAGLILIDGGVPQGVPGIETNLKTLGFDIKQVKYILSTEPHFDHAGGIAALARDSGATVLAGVAAVPGLTRGTTTPDDPQAKYDSHWPAVAKVRGVRDGETIRLGDTVVTALATPGHTMGSTSWSWRSCEGRKCLPVVFASSLNPTTHDSWRYSTKAGAPYIAALRKSIARYRRMTCGILFSAHPEQSDGEQRYRRLLAGAAPNPFVDPGACRAYAGTFDKLLNERLADERAGRR